MAKRWLLTPVEPIFDEDISKAINATNTNKSLGADLFDASVLKKD